MKIQSVNNNSYQNNISHKAKFAKNANFKRIFGYTNSERLSTGLIKRFQQLPAQELEILNISALRTTTTNKYVTISVFNNSTLKTLSAEVNMDENGCKALPELMREIISDKQFFEYTYGRAKDFRDLTNY